MDQEVQLNIKTGEYIEVLGSTKTFDPWKKKKHLNWIDTSWLCNIECRNGETMEPRFDVEQVDRNKVWEVGDYHEWKPRKISQTTLRNESISMILFDSVDYQELIKKKSDMVFMFDVTDFNQQIQPSLRLWSDTGWTNAKCQLQYLDVDKKFKCQHGNVSFMNWMQLFLIFQSNSYAIWMVGWLNVRIGGILICVGWVCNMECNGGERWVCECYCRVRMKINLN
ncbi:putative phosphoglucan, water dikinase [Helianthus debilis subsp. tardiflorus]